MRDRSTITNALRLLGLPEDMKSALRDGSISPGHARAILMVDTEEGRRTLFQKILSKGLSVREAEQRATSSRTSSPSLSRKDSELEGFPHNSRIFSTGFVFLDETQEARSRSRFLHAMNSEGSFMNLSHWISSMIHSALYEHMNNIMEKIGENGKLPT